MTLYILIGAALVSLCLIVIYFKKKNKKNETNITDDPESNQTEIKEKGLSLDSPAYGAVGNVISAGTNIPTDRVYNIVNNAQAALDKNNAAWQRVAVALGWNKWDVGIRDIEKTKEQDKKENQAINPEVERNRKIIEARKRNKKRK